MAANLFFYQSDVLLCDLPPPLGIPAHKNPQITPTASVTSGKTWHVKSLSG
jgi:hypothetical protein